MKKSSVHRPVSHKAYTRFVERINLVITDPVKRDAMLAALDKYLEGDRDTYDCELTPDCALTFRMLRFDIDLAIARSAKARMRARRRKGPVADEVKPASPVTRQHSIADMAAMLREIAEKYSAEHGLAHETAEDEEEGVAEDMPQPFVAPKTRRQRRAEARCSRQKSRWRKL